MMLQQLRDFSLIIREQRIGGNIRENDVLFRSLNRWPCRFDLSGGLVPFSL